MIPIPIKRDHNNFIQNFEPKQLIKLNSAVAEIPAYMVKQFSQIKGLTVCHNTALSQLLQVDTCTEAILDNKSTEGICTYKKLQYESQLIQVSEESIYVHKHINFPILLRISCGDVSKIFNVTHSGEIFHEFCKAKF